MKNFLSSLLGTLVGILIMTIVVFLIFMGIVAASTSREVPEVEENSVLVARFNSPVIDRTDESPFSRLFRWNMGPTHIMGLNHVLRDIEKAQKDEHIKGILLHLSDIPTGISILGEIRDALVEFRESGKFIYAYADIYSHKSFYLASVADSVFMTPEGLFLFNGLSAEVTFFKNALDKLGVDMQVVKHGSYKSAAEPFTRDDLSEENRRQIEGYVGAIWDHMLGEIGESRGLTPDQLNSYADNLITSDNGAIVENGMIDGLIYFDELLSHLKQKMGVDEEDDLESISLARYGDVPAEKKKEYTRDKVAVVYAMGMVVDGDAGEGYIGSERIARAIRKARRDNSVKAIVFRVNSGGGSAIASDVVYREAMLAAREKPVVASMGDVAASGGYYIVAPADTILASPTTITGSIGVVFTIPNMKGLLNEKLGITTDVVNTNRHSNLISVTDPLDETERAYIQKMVDDTYDAFVDVVAGGRNLSPEEVDSIGGGRVWSGKDALELGLIDMYGGLDKSIEVAAEMAGLENYRIQSLPKLEDPLTMLINELTGAASVRAMKKELGKEFRYYQKIREIKEIRGLQAILPCEIDVR